MINDELAKQMLADIETKGAALPENQIINPAIGQLDNIISRSSGLPSIRSSVVSKFNLILSRPLLLSAFNASQIRCCLCKKIISYPAWYYSIKYATTQLHFFVCFDGNSPTKVNCKCYRKG